MHGGELTPETLRKFSSNSRTNIQSEDIQQSALPPIIGLFPYFFQLTGFIMRNLNIRDSALGPIKWVKLYDSICKVAYFESDFKSESIEVILSFAMWKESNTIFKNWSPSKRELYQIFNDESFGLVYNSIPAVLEDICNIGVDIGPIDPGIIDVKKRGIRNELCSLCVQLLSDKQPAILETTPLNGSERREDDNYAIYPGALFNK